MHVSVPFEILRKKISAIATAGMGHICMLLVVTGIAAALVSIQKPAAVWVRNSSGHPVPVQKMSRLQHLPRQLHRKLNDNAYTSVNWAGYAVTGAQGSVTDVQASWVVPKVNCANTSADGPNVYASFWTGIDGWTSNSVEQIGTDSDCQSPQGKLNTPTYYAWFEFYPAASYYVGTPSTGFANYVVLPGDQMSAEVKVIGSCNQGPRHQGGGQEFEVIITDLSSVNHWSFNTSSCLNAQRSSAEWITETPYGCKTKSHYCYLPNFGLAGYGDASTPLNNVVAASATVSGVNGGQPQALGNFGDSIQQSIMVTANAPTTPIPMSDVMAYPAPSCVASYPLTTGTEGIIPACLQATVIGDVQQHTSFGMQWTNPGP